MLSFLVILLLKHVLENYHLVFLAKCRFNGKQINIYTVTGVLSCLLKDKNVI